MLKRKQGQIIDKSHSAGLGVCEMWIKLFEENEYHFKAKQYNKVMTDEEITEIMLKAFPAHKNSKILHLVHKVRGRYNRGRLLKDAKSKVRSFKYVCNEKGKIERKAGVR